MINIPKDVIDPFYRYKRQEIKISQQKLGIKIDNLDDVSRAIYLNPKTIMKYYQKYFGCQSKDDILYNKKITSNSLDEALENLIKKLICIKCSNPEIKFFKNKKKIEKSCNACGECIEITDNDLKKLLINEC
tara:strand:- start:6 stop:401 length:396 start_codon:yes stop_codon:yes gene_type:complete